jgi:PsbP-like protein
MKPKKIVLLLSWVIIAIANSPILAQMPRETCPDIPQVTPTEESREISNEEFGFNFKIPANYRTERRQEENELRIFLRNPADVELLECCRINREVGCGHRISDVVIQVENRPDNLQNIWDLAVSNDDYTQIINAEETKISNQDAVIYTVQYQPDAIYQYASFFTPDREYLVTISAGDYGKQIDPIDQIIFNQVVNSFEFMGTSR